MTLGWRFGDETWWAPEVSAGWRTRFSGAQGRTTAHFDGGADFTLDPEAVSKGGAVLRAGFRGGSSQMLYGVTGGGTFDSRFQAYDIRAILRFQF